MAVTLTEQTRNERNIVTGIRCIAVNPKGVQSYADVLKEQVVGVMFSAVTAPVLAILNAGVDAATISPGLALTYAQVSAIARAAGSRV